MGVGGEEDEGIERRMEDRDRGVYKAEEGRHRKSKRGMTEWKCYSVTEETKRDGESKQHFYELAFTWRLFWSHCTSHRLRGFLALVSRHAAKWITTAKPNKTPAARTRTPLYNNRYEKAFGNAASQKLSYLSISVPYLIYMISDHLCIACALSPDWGSL